MFTEVEKVIQIATEELRKLLPEDKATGIEIEEIEEHSSSGHYFVTLGYWARDNKPRLGNGPPSTAKQLVMGGSPEDFFNPWRKNSSGSKLISPKGRQSPFGCMNLLWGYHELQCW